MLLRNGEMLLRQRNLDRFDLRAALTERAQPVEHIDLTLRDNGERSLETARADAISSDAGTMNRRASTHAGRGTPLGTGLAPASNGSSAGGKSPA